MCAHSASSNQKPGAAATVSIVATIASFLLIFTANPGWGLLAALVAIPAGIVGLVVAASPRIGGGLLSLISTVLGAIAGVLAILGIIGALLF